MAEKTLNTRIQLKHDIAANWAKATNFIPKLGEIIVYDTDADYNYSRMKIGDGKTAVGALPFTFHQEDYYGLIEDEGFLASANCLEGTGIQAKSYISAQQAGSGDISPTNIRAINGWDTVTLTRIADNMINPANVVFEKFYISSSQFMSYSSADRCFAIPCEANTTYTVEKKYPSTFRVATSVEYPTAGGAPTLFVEKGRTQKSEITITTGANDKYLVIQLFGSNDTYYGAEYHLPYIIAYKTNETQKLTAELPQTVYGGSIDWNTGVLTVTHRAQIFDGTEAWTRASSGTYQLNSALYSKTASSNTDVKHICSHFIASKYSSSPKNNTCYELNNNRLVIKCDSIATLDEWLAYLAGQANAGTPVIIVWELLPAYHTTHQLTPQQMKALQGINTVWSNCGDTHALFNCSPFINTTYEAISNDEIDAICGQVLASIYEVSW